MCVNVRKNKYEIILLRKDPTKCTVAHQQVNMVTYEQETGAWLSLYKLTIPQEM